jgi:hypothetical protein
MTNQNATQTKRPDQWVNRFGVLKNVRKTQTRNGKPMVQCTIVGKNAQGQEFYIPTVAYGDTVMKAILNAGNGSMINLRGTIESYDKPMEGGKYTERTTIFKAIMINEKKDAAPQTPSPDTAAETTTRTVSEEEIPL